MYRSVDIDSVLHALLRAALPNFLRPEHIVAQAK
jgi:hypothetical protein